MALVAHAPTGDRPGLLGEALKILAELRRLGFRQPVIAAYLAALRAADRRARAGSVRDLAGPFAYRLDRGVLTATQNTRTAFKQAREDNLDDIVDEATIAHTDRQGPLDARGLGGHERRHDGQTGHEPRRSGRGRRGRTLDGRGRRVLLLRRLRGRGRHRRRPGTALPSVLHLRG